MCGTPTGARPPPRELATGPRAGRTTAPPAPGPGRAPLRLVCANPDLTEADIDEFFVEIRRAAAVLRGF